MRFDQFGYPSDGKDWQQILSSQVTASSEAYDALLAYRSYRSPLPVEEVLDNISQLKGTQLHPLLVDGFMNFIKQVHTEH